MWSQTQHNRGRASMNKYRNNAHLDILYPKCPSTLFTSKLLPSYLLWRTRTLPRTKKQDSAHTIQQCTIRRRCPCATAVLIHGVKNEHRCQDLWHTKWTHQHRSGCAASWSNWRPHAHGLVLFSATGTSLRNVPSWLLLLPADGRRHRSQIIVIVTP